MNTVIVDSLIEVPEVTTPFTFEDAFVTASISQSGIISVASRAGRVNAITQTQPINNTGSAINVTIQTRVRVPAGYSNYNDYVQGSVTASQPSITAPSPTTTFSSNVAGTTASLNGKINRNNVGVTTVGFNWGYNTTGTALTASELQTVGTSSGTTVLSVSQAHGTVNFKSDVTSLPNSKLISFIAFATNSVGTEYGDVKTFNTAAVIAPTYNQLPDNRIFIFPTAGDQYGANLYPGYREFEKSNGAYYFAAVASKSSGLYADYSNLTTGVTWSNTGPTTLTFNDTELQNFAKTSSVNASTATSGIYTVTASASGLTSGTAQILTGNASQGYKSIFTLNFAKTGTGTVPFVAAFDHTATGLHWNASPAPLALFSIGPFEQSQKGVIMVPLSTDNTINFSGSTTAQFNGGVFDPTNLDVSITGKTEGVDYDYYISTEAMSIWGVTIGPVPAVIIEAEPYVLNGGSASATHTLNITYNY